LDVSVEKEKLGAAQVEIGVHKGPVSHRREILGVEKPDQLRRPGEKGKAHRHLLRARPVDVLVQAIMKQVVTVAAPQVGRT